MPKEGEKSKKRRREASDMLISKQTSEKTKSTDYGEGIIFIRREIIKRDHQDYRDKLHKIIP